MNRQKSLRRALRSESLERREVMAGNVGAFVSNGELVITGDERENALVAWQGANPGEVVLAGAKDSSGGNTLVEGQAGPLTFSGVTRISLYLRGGNDRVLVTNLSLPAPPAGSGQRSFSADLGAGNDQVVFSGNTGTARHAPSRSTTNNPFPMVRCNCKGRRTL